MVSVESLISDFKLPMNNLLGPHDEWRVENYVSNLVSEAKENPQSTFSKIILKAYEGETCLPMQALGYWSIAASPATRSLKPFEKMRQKDKSQEQKALCDILAGLPIEECEVDIAVLLKEKGKAAYDAFVRYESLDKGNEQVDATLLSIAPYAILGAGVVCAIGGAALGGAMGGNPRDALEVAGDITLVATGVYAGWRVGHRGAVKFLKAMGERGVVSGLKEHEHDAMRSYAHMLYRAGMVQQYLNQEKEGGSVISFGGGLESLQRLLQEELGSDAAGMRIVVQSMTARESGRFPS